MNLHEVIVQLHEHFPSRLTRSIYDYSCKVTTSCPSGDLADLNRVRFLTQVFQSKQGCSQFQLPCKCCGKAEKSHPWQRTCPRRHMLAGRKVLHNGMDCAVCKTRFVVNANMSSCRQCNFDMCDDCVRKYACQTYAPGPLTGPCTCGKLRPSHPWEKNSVLDCQCESENLCILFVVKAFFSHGGLDAFMTIIHRVAAGSTPVHLAIQRWCLQVLWLWTCAISWEKCWGGGFTRIAVESQTVTRSGLKQEVEFVLVVTSGANVQKRKKKASVLLPFLESLTDLLREKIDFPNITKVKTKMSDGVVVGAYVSEVFSMLGTPANFQTMLEVDKARELFSTFLEIPQPTQTTRNEFSNYVKMFVQPHRATRSLPTSLLHALLRILIGDTTTPNLEIIDDARSIPKETNTFAVAKVQDIWVLSQILIALPAAQDEVAVTFLWEINDFFTRQPHANTNMLEDNFHLWFFPILFDVPDQKTEGELGVKSSNDGTGKKDRVLASEHLAVDILSGAHAFHLLAHLRVQESLDPIAESKSSVREPRFLTTEELLANTLVAIGAHGGEGAVPWSKRNVGILQAVANGLIYKVVASVSFFRNSPHHSAWSNIFETLCLYRNMTWAPLPTNDSSSPEAMKNMVRYLVSPNSNQLRSSPTQGIVLLSEHTLSMLRNLLVQLKLFDMDLDDAGDEVQRFKELKGKGLAYVAYFRDCIACFRIKTSHEDHVKMMAQFFWTFAFDSSYSKEEEDRLKYIDETEARRRRSAVMKPKMRSKTTISKEDQPMPELKQRVRDLETLEGGTAVWQLSKGKIEQCYLYLKWEAAAPVLDASHNQKRPSEMITKPRSKSQQPPPLTGKWMLIVESQRKKIGFAYFEQATLEIGTADVKLLAKHEVLYAQHRCLTLVTVKKKRVDLLCTTVEGYDCWVRIIPSLKDIHSHLSPPPLPPLPGQETLDGHSREDLEAIAAGLQGIIASLHHFSSTTLSADCLAYSEKVYSICSHVTPPELGLDLADYNRLLFLLNFLIPRTSCKKFCLPCQYCGKVDDVHPWQRTARYTCPKRHLLQGRTTQNGDLQCAVCNAQIPVDATVSSCKECGWNMCEDCVRKNGCLGYSENADAKVCGCGRLESAHPWEQQIPLECRCGSADPCFLFAMKTLLGYGVRDWWTTFWQRIAASITPIHLHLKGLLLHFGWIFANLPTSISRCWGGTFVRVHIESHTTVRVGLKMDTEFTLMVDANMNSVQKRKKLPAMMAFQESLTNLLWGLIECPDVTRGKNKAVDIDAVALSLADLFTVLSMPSNFQKLLTCDRARELFFNFLEIEQPPPITKSDWTQCYHAFVLSHRHSRTLPTPILHSLVSLLNGETPPPSAAPIASLAPFKQPVDKPFSLSKFQEITIFPFLLGAIPYASHEAAISLLWEINEFFSRQPQANLKLLVEPKFQTWFFPLLFDQSENERSSPKEQERESKVQSLTPPPPPPSPNGSISKKSDRVVACFQMAVDILGGAHAHYLVRIDRTELEQSIESIIATTFVSIGNFVGKGENNFAGIKLEPWSAKHIDVIQQVANGIIHKLGSVVSIFRNSITHQGWQQTLEILNVYRNLTWCPSDFTEDQTIRYLLNHSAAQIKSPATQPAVTLLGESTLGMLRTLFFQLKIFEINDPTWVDRVKLVKGEALGYMMYFRDCLTCVRAAKGQSLPDRIKSMGLFFWTYIFDPIYSKEDEERLKAIEEFERKQKPKIGTGKPDENIELDPHENDLDALARGITVWQSIKGKLLHCTLFIKQENLLDDSKDDEVGAGGKRKPGHGKTQTSAFVPSVAAKMFSVYIESQRKKIFQALLEEIALETGTSDTKLLTKNGFEFTQQMGLCLWQKQKRMDFICIGIEDFERCNRVIKVFQERHLMRDHGGNNEEDAAKKILEAQQHLVVSPPTLHELIGLMHKHYPTSITTGLLAMSDKVQVACASLDPELASGLSDFNRLRSLVQVFQAKIGCQQFSLPCQYCGKCSAVHPWQRAVRYQCPGRHMLQGRMIQTAGLDCANCRAKIEVGSAISTCKDCAWNLCENCVRKNGCLGYSQDPEATVCACGKPENVHPWTQDVPLRCQCGSEDPCLLFVMKTFMLHGGRESLLAVCQGVLLGLNPLQRHVQRWCLHLLWLLCSVPTPAFVRCGSFIQAHVEAHAVRTGLFQEAEFVVVVDGNLTQVRKRKPFAAVRNFLESQLELLRGVVDFSDLGPLKNEPEAMQVMLKEMLRILAMPENFDKMFNVRKSRDLVIHLLELEVNPHIEVSRALFAQCVAGFIQPNRSQRHLSVDVLECLVRIMSGENIPPHNEIVIVDVNQIESDLPPRSNAKVKEPWPLSLILPAVPCCTEQVAVEFLRSLNHFFIKKPDCSKAVLNEEKFAQWFLPLLFFDHVKTFGNNNTLAEEFHPFYLTINILSIIYAQHVLNKNTKDSSLQEPSDELFASTISLLGNTNIAAYATPLSANTSTNTSSSSSEGGGWTPRNVEVLQSLANGVLGKLVASGTQFRNNVAHPAWDNIFAVLHMFRHMTWCPCSGEETVRHLLGRPSAVVSKSICKVLLSEHTVTMIRNLLLQLRFFDLDFANGLDAQEILRLKQVKGEAVALFGFFRECYACFRTAKQQEDKECLSKIMSYFYSAYSYDTSYSKDEEDRMRMIDSLDARRRRSAVLKEARVGEKKVPQPENEDNTVELRKQYTRDVEVLVGGMMVWKIAAKGKPKQGYIYLKRDTNSDSKQSKDNNGMAQKDIIILDFKEEKTFLTLFEQTTLDVGTSESKLLGLHGLEFAQQMGLTLYKNKKRIDLVCTSIEDFSCWVRVLPSLKEQHALQNPTLSPSEDRPSAENPNDPTNANSKNLHRVIVSVNRNNPTSLSAAMLSQNERIQTACSNLPDDVRHDLADFNRLRYLVHFFQARVGCPEFSLPCGFCSKRSQDHPWARTVRFACPGRHPLSSRAQQLTQGECAVCKAQLPVDSPLLSCKECSWDMCEACLRRTECKSHVPRRIEKNGAPLRGVCSCGKAESAHPWENFSILTCRCGSEVSCQVFVIKTFLAYGGLECIKNIFARVQLGSSPLQLWVQQWCLALLWLLASIPLHLFKGCAGGVYVKCFIQSCSSNRLALKQEAEYVISVDRGNGVETQVRKKLSVLTTFQDTMSELLKGVVDISKHVKQTTKTGTEYADLVTASATEMFSTLCFPANFQKMMLIDKARELFNSFFEIELPSGGTRSELMQLINGFIQSCRATRSLPVTVVHALLRMLSGEPAPATTDIIESVDSLPEIPSSDSFTLQNIREISVLPSLLLAASAVTDDVAVNVLQEINDFLTRQPSENGRIVAEEKFRLWFLPVLFDGGTLEEKQQTSIKRTAMESVMLHLAVDILSGVHSYHVLSQGSSGANSEQLSVEGLFASTLVMAGSYAGLDKGVKVEPWTKPGLELIQALTNGVIYKLIASSAVFQNSHHEHHHLAWMNVWDVMNIFRNMIWCPFKTAAEDTDKQILRHFLNRSSNQNRNPAQPANVLLTEHTVSMVRTFLLELKLFELDVGEPPSERIMAMKGNGLAYTSFFRDCQTFFRVGRNQSPEEQARILGQFFTTYVFDSSFSKAEEERLRTIDETEVRRRRSVMVNQKARMQGANAVFDVADEQKQHLRDLETLAGGVTVWQVPSKGKILQCYLSLKRTATVDSPEAKKPPPPPRRLFANNPPPPPTSKSDRSQSDKNAFQSVDYTIVIESQRKRLYLVLFEQATLEVGQVDHKVLSRQGLEYAQTMGLSLWQNKKKMDLVCTSQDDFECWTRVLAVLREGKGLRPSLSSGERDVGSLNVEWPRDLSVNTVEFATDALSLAFAPIAELESITDDFETDVRTRSRGVFGR